MKVLKILIWAAYISINAAFAQNLFNPYSSQGYSYGYGFSPNTIPFDVTLAQMGLGIGIPSPYSYLYSASTYPAYDPLNSSFYSTMSSYPEYMSGNQFQQFAMPSFGSQLAMNLPSLFQDYFNKTSAPLDDETAPSNNVDHNSDAINSSDEDKESCKKSGDKTWNGSECVTLGNETDCNQELGHIWSNGVCKFKEELSKEECDAGTDTVWAIKCVDISTDKTFCDKFSELTWIGDKCYKVSKINSDICAKDSTKQWNDSSKTCDTKPVNKCKENEIPYKEQCLSAVTKEYCLDPNSHGGHPGTWFHGTCWDVGCEQDDKKTDKLCVAAKNESDSIKSCSDNGGEWVGAKRDSKNEKEWIEGHCNISNKSNTDNDKGSSGDFKLFISSSTDFLKSDKKTDGQHPNMKLLGACLENISYLGDRNIQFIKDKDQYSFRDSVKGQNGFTIANKNSSFFIEDRDLIKIRDENCKDEINAAIQNRYLEKSKLKCSVNFKIGDETYTVIFSKGNILANKPQFIINNSGTGIHESNFNVIESNKKIVNYKNLYLGIENAFKEKSKDVRDNCSRDLRKYTSDSYVGSLLNFAGACDAVLTTGWKDQDIDPKLESDLKDAIGSCKLQSKHSHGKNDEENPAASSVSK